MDRQENAGEIALAEEQRRARFEQIVLPHLGAAYNLARWLVRSADDAEDLVQDASLRAYHFLDGYHGGDARAWLLAIVRNTCFTWLHQRRVQDSVEEFEEGIHTPLEGMSTPETLLLQQVDGEMLRQALEELPARFREVLVLRELEGLSYKEIADVAGIPIGTVMSSLARARQRLRGVLVERMKGKH